MSIRTLQPERLWKEFYEICQIPHPSKKEEKMIAYLQEFGKRHNLETRTDAAGNVLICKPATPGYENRKKVILQSHMDMVCEKIMTHNTTLTLTLFNHISTANG